MEHTQLFKLKGHHEQQIVKEKKRKEEKKKKGTFSFCKSL